MSGDVQPRKRKDKRRKKDDLGLEEPRGTAAVFGEGDVLMHSHHEHGTGGHWCAKIIFFSLLAILVTLIGLIILENRGLSELEANAVESRYSGVLEGWIEDAPDDDHHDEHTLELKHHSYEDIHDDDDNQHDGDDDDQHDIELEHEEEDDEHEEDGNDEEDDDNDDDNNDDDGDQDEDDSEEQNIEEDDDDEDDGKIEYNKYRYEEQADDEDDDDEDNDDKDNDDDGENDQDSENNVSQEDHDDDDSEEDQMYYNIHDNDDNDNNEEHKDNYDNDISTEQYENDKDTVNEDAEDNEEDEDDMDEEIERIEREVIDEEELAISTELPPLEHDDSDKETDEEEIKEEGNNEDENTSEGDEDIVEPPIVEQIAVPSGKPFVELEDEPSSEKPTDTLAEEEEYEKRQEQIRLEKEEASSQMWLKLVVGGALLLATHAVIRRSTAPRDTPEREDNTTREETPSIIDRRMTLIPKEAAPLLTREIYEPVLEESVERLVSYMKPVQTVPIHKQDSDADLEDAKVLVKEEVAPVQESKDVLDKELYSDDEEEDDVEEPVVKEKENPKDKENVNKKDAEDSESEDVPDDVEIIDDEQIEEEIEEEDEDEEEISDVDDAELLSRLEAKYGRLPEPERPGQKYKDGGNNIEDDWPGEPSELYWRQQLDSAEQEIRQGEWAAAGGRLAAAAVAGSGRALWLAARALDAEAEQRRDNKLLARAISAYLQLLKMNERLSDGKLLEVTARVLNRIQFKGNYLSAEPVYRLLIRRFPNDISYRNNLTVSFLMANRADLAADVLKETLKLWPNDPTALAHYGFVLKTHYNDIEGSVELFRKALENDTGPACEPRFYYHLGDALLLLGRFEEAHEIHKRGARHGHFLSPAQRSLYNVERLKSRPWWRIEETPYIKLSRALERSWKEILKEGEAARSLYEKEKEGLKEKGEWSQLDIFVRGQEIPGRCKRAPVTCSIVKAEVAAANCRRGQIKFSSMEPGTHVRPHVGPTNCRLRMHLGLSNTKDTYIRVDQEIRQWQVGKVLLFDDSFEHEVWHNGTGSRLVLIVDVWHPDLSAAERRQLPAI